MTPHKGLLLLTMVAIVLFLASNFTSSVFITTTTLNNPLEDLFLPPQIPLIFAVDITRE